MDLAQSIEPNSQQVNAEDLLTGSRTVTITGVEKGTAEQPVFIHLAEFEGRTYRPGKSMRRIFVAAWGTDSSSYIGRMLTIYNDPTIKFGKELTGGIRISHMSHLTAPLTVALTVTRGRRAPFVVHPLNPPKDTSGRDWLTELTAADGNPSAIQALGIAAKNAHAQPAVLTVIRQAYKDATPGQPVAVPTNGDQQ
jgi:hypothetical protein